MDAASKVIQCPQCGSTDVNMVAEDYGNCKNCGAKVVLRNEPIAQVVKNDVHIHYDGGTADGEKKQVNIINFVVKQEFPAENFVRSSLLQIASDQKTPEDVFNAEFMPAKTCYRQLLGVSADVDLKYSASVGYDRQEEYLAQEKYYDNDLQRECTRTVTKTRTVTDWRPTSGGFSNKAVCYADNSNKDEFSDADIWRFRDALKTAEKKSLLPLEQVDFHSDMPNEPSAKGITEAKKSCVDSVETDCRHKLGGDHIKNFSATSKIKVNTIYCAVAPEYEMDYKYDGKTYNYKQFAFGKSELDGENVNAASEIEKIVETRAMPSLLAAIGALLVSIIISCFVRVSALNIIFFLVAVGVFIFNKIYYQKIQNQIINDKQKTKCNALIKKLQEYKLEPLTSQETLNIGGQK